VPLIDRVLAAKPGEKVVGFPEKPAAKKAARPRAAQPISRFNDGGWWIRGRGLEKRNEIAANAGAEYDIVMVGDSITHRWERKGGEGRALFAGLKKTYRILNLGYGGDRTEHVIWRLSNGELEGYTAKLFTVMIGTNNRDKNPADVAAGVKRILALIQEKHPESKIVLMPIFPRGPSKDGRHARNVKVNEIIKGYADGEKIRWLDFNSRFLTPEGVLTKKVMNDLLHPNQNGYQIWLDAISPLFKEIVGK
jgi:beta-glucosidase